MNPPNVETRIIDENRHRDLFRHVSDLTAPKRKVTMREFVEDAIKQHLKKTGSSSDFDSVRPI